MIHSDEQLMFETTSIEFFYYGEITLLTRFNNQMFEKLLLNPAVLLRLIGWCVSLYVFQ